MQRHKYSAVPIFALIFNPKKILIFRTISKLTFLKVPYFPNKGIVLPPTGIALPEPCVSQTVKTATACLGK